MAKATVATIAARTEKTRAMAEARRAGLKRSIKAKINARKARPHARVCVSSSFARRKSRHTDGVQDKHKGQAMGDDVIEIVKSAASKLVFLGARKAETRLTQYLESDCRPSSPACCASSSHYAFG